MKIEVQKNLQDNIYTVSLSILDYEDGNYAEAVHDFGETALNFGGKVMDADGTTVLASLADKTIKVSSMANEPVVQSFSTIQYGENTEKVANQWGAQMVMMIDAYVKEMSAKIDTFTSTQIIDI